MFSEFSARIYLFYMSTTTVPSTHNTTSRITDNSTVSANAAMLILDKDAHSSSSLVNVAPIQSTTALTYADTLKLVTKAISQSDRRKFNIIVSGLPESVTPSKYRRHLKRRRHMRLMPSLRLETSYRLGQTTWQSNYKQQAQTSAPRTQLTVCCL